MMFFKKTEDQINNVAWIHLLTLENVSTMDTLGIIESNQVLESHSNNILLIGEDWKVTYDIKKGNCLDEALKKQIHGMENNIYTL